MMPDVPGSARRGQLRRLPLADRWRASVAGPASATATYKEWMHFCVRLPGRPASQLLVNMSLADSAGTRGPIRRPRLVVMAKADGWSGSVEHFDPAEVEGAAGAMDVRLGASSLVWRDGSYTLTLRTPSVAAELRMRVLTPAGVPTCVSFAPGHAMYWVVTPRLAATGWVRLGDEQLSLEDEPAYHDHNWGDFRWDGDLQWRWGFIHPREPDNPWSLVFAHVAGGWPRRLLTQSALVWRGDRLVRMFHGREVTFGHSGDLDVQRPLTLPGIAGLLLGEGRSAVPSRIDVQGRGMGEELDIAISPTSLARLAVPSETDDFRLAILNETTVLAEVRGEIKGEGRFAFPAAGVVEFVGG